MPTSSLVCSHVCSFYDYKTALSAACHADMISFTRNIKIMLFMHYECTCTLHCHFLYVEYSFGGLFFYSGFFACVCHFFHVFFEIKFSSHSTSSMKRSSIITKLICSLFAVTNWKLSVFLTFQRNKLLIEVCFVCVCVCFVFASEKLSFIFYCVTSEPKLIR